MAKRIPLEAITDAADTPITPETKEGKPQTANRLPSEPKESAPTDKVKYVDRTIKKTYYMDKATLEEAQEHRQGTGESISALVNRALRELLDREAK